MDQKSYLTVKEEGCGEYIEKKSRFIGYAKPVETEAEAAAFIREIRARHHDATHHCYAYQIGEQDQLQRSSDDGEPAGTAGRPILEVIKKSGLKNTCVVVTRYFGGILLGAGGLVRAYSHSAQVGVTAAGIVEKIPAATLSLTMGYALWGKVENYLAARQLAQRDVQYLENVTVRVLTPYAEVEQVERDITELGNGQIVILKLSEKDWLTREV